MSEEIGGQNDERDEEFENDDSNEQLESIIHISGMYKEWFLDYASYVILERAVPHLHDGLKPVQRRILHSLKELDDGRYHKVANVIGNTMKYHPHGDASIGDAMVQIGQKELLLDMQGNWGNIYTGDRAAAARYIEVRLNKFALDVVFNPKTTNWLQSYDGRNKEPDTLPVKFPLLLAQGVEGIAVGLACKILPHNFIELINGSIDILKGKRVRILPDFLTAGMADFTNYNEGLRGGKVKVRARMKKEDKTLLLITEIPFGTTTSSLIESILRANTKGKIKIKKVEDNTAAKVEIAIHLPKAVSPDRTIDALYAFTDCELSISPNSTVIEDDKPHFLTVNEQLRRSTMRTKDLLQLELEIRLSELQEQWHFTSLEKIFIENRIYRDIEECETWEAILEAIHSGLKPHIKHLLREVTDDDVTRLTEIRIKRISKFDSFKADEKLNGLNDSIAEVKYNLENLVDFAVAYFKRIKEKHGEGKERKTEIMTFDNIDAKKVAVMNTKLYANFAEGFIGSGLKKSESEFIADCSDISDIIIFRKDGKMLVTRISSKAFVGKNILHVGVWKKGDKRTIYNMIYLDGKGGKTMMKRFSVTSITRDKEYSMGKDKPGTKVLYFTANPNGEAESVTVHLRQLQRLKKLKMDIDFSDLAIKGRGAGGNTVTKFPVKKVELKSKGKSTLSARKIWYDDTVRRLNSEERGKLLGEFHPEDKLLVILDSGEYKLTSFDLSNHFDDNMITLEKWIPEKPMSVVYFEGKKENWFVKRFLVEPTAKKTLFISDTEGSKLGLATTLNFPVGIIRYNKKFKITRDRDDEPIDLVKFISVKGLKSIGNKLSNLPITEVNLGEPDFVKEKLVDEERFGSDEEVILNVADGNDTDVGIETDDKVIIKEEEKVVSDSEIKESTPIEEKKIEAPIKIKKAKKGLKPIKPKSRKKIEPIKDDVSKPIDLDVDTDDDGQINLF